MILPITRTFPCLYVALKTQLLLNFRKKWENVARLLQDFFRIYFQIHQSCMIFIFFKILAKVVLIARILQNFCKNFSSCELGYIAALEKQRLIFVNNIRTLRCFRVFSSNKLMTAEIRAARKTLSNCLLGEILRYLYSSRLLKNFALT